MVIPFAEELAARCNARAVRLRRDFTTVLTLISAHALLHQMNRSRDKQGRVVATIDDYRSVHALVGPVISEGVLATVNSSVRETVEAVQTLGNSGRSTVSLAQLAQLLELDKSTASRRARVAQDLGYLVNVEDRKGRTAMLILGEPLPGDESVLPAPDEIGGEGGYATVAATVQHCNTVVESIPVPINEASEAGPEYDQLEAWQLSFLAEAEKLSS